MYSTGKVKLLWFIHTVSPDKDRDSFSYFNNLILHCLKRNRTIDRLLFDLHQGIFKYNLHFTNTLTNLNNSWYLSEILWLSIYYFILLVNDKLLNILNSNQIVSVKIFLTFSI